MTERRIDRRSLRRLLGLLRRHRRALAIGFTALIGVDLLQLLVPRLTQEIVDRLAGGAAAPSTLWLLAGATVLVSIGMGLCRFLWRYFLIGSSHRIERDLRQ